MSYKYGKLFPCVNNDGNVVMITPDGQYHTETNYAAQLVLSPTKVWAGIEGLHYLNDNNELWSKRGEWNIPHVTFKLRDQRISKIHHTSMKTQRFFIRMVMVLYQNGEFEILARTGGFDRRGWVLTLCPAFVAMTATDIIDFYITNGADRCYLLHQDQHLELLKLSEQHFAPLDTRAPITVCERYNLKLCLDCENRFIMGRRYFFGREYLMIVDPDNKLWKADSIGNFKLPGMEEPAPFGTLLSCNSLTQPIQNCVQLHIHHVNMRDVIALAGGRLYKCSPKSRIGSDQMVIEDPVDLGFSNIVEIAGSNEILYALDDQGRVSTLSNKNEIHMHIASNIRSLAGSRIPSA